MTNTIVYPVVYKQKHLNIHNALIQYEKYLDSLLYIQIKDLNKIASNLADIANHFFNPVLSK